MTQVCPGRNEFPLSSPSIVGSNQFLSSSFADVNVKLLKGVIDNFR